MAKAQRHAPKGPIKGTDPMTASDPMRDPRAGKCVGHSKQTGKLCTQPAIRGGTVCRYHGGGAPQVQAKAKERLAALAPKAIQVMDRLLEREQFPTVQFQASRFLIEQEVGKAIEHVEQQINARVSLVRLLEIGETAR